MCETAVDGLRFTREELAEFNGGDGRPLYLAIRKRVYDVTEGPSFYGVGRTYHKFVGRDATRAFGTACTSDECLLSSETGLTAAQLKVWEMEMLSMTEAHNMPIHTLAC